MRTRNTIIGYSILSVISICLVTAPIILGMEQVPNSLSATQENIDGSPGDLADDNSADSESNEKDSKWLIESPRGPVYEQGIDAREGTWISLDVSPDGTEIIFDFLGDLYVMPISGANGTEGRFAEKLTSGIAWDMQPRFSHDGNWIAFTSDRNGESGKAGDNIWILNRETKEFRQISDEPFRLLNGPAWSPDDQYIVARKHFTSRRSLGAGEMWMFHRDAADAKAMKGVPLTKRPNDQKDVNEPVFSPDGKYLYYSQDSTPGSTFQYDKDSNKQVYVIKRLDLESGESESYITGPGGACRPTPSPDGKRIAFVRRVGAKTVLHIFNTKSGAVRAVYDRLERDMQEAWAIHGVYPSFAWMPDGESIVVWAKGKIRRIVVSSGDEHVIPFHIKDTRTITKSLRFPIEVAPDEFDVKMLRWVQTSPKGNQVVFQALGHIYVRELPDGKPRRLTNQTKDFEFYPSFSNDGRYIAYTTWNDETFGAIRVASVDEADGENWKVTSEPGHYINPSFSPNGEIIVFEKKMGGGLLSPLWSRDPGVYTVPARGGEPERISKTGSHPQFAGNGERIFLRKSNSEKDADNLQLVSIDLSGHRERIHYTSQWATDYRVSPDGKWIAFIERFNVYLAPFVQTGRAIEIGPKFQGLPVKRISEQAGDWIHFSGDSEKLHWTLGPKLYTWNLSELHDRSPIQEGSPQTPKAASIEIGFRAKHAVPDGMVALVGGRIVTMGPKGILDEGTILIEGNRIRAMGESGKIRVPSEARVINIKGQTVIPGFVDTHAHGAQATLGITPQQSWVDHARLAFGVTTIHDPSNNTQNIFAASEMTKAGLIVAPRTFSTGTILYGAAGSYKAEIESLDDALFHLRRMKASGAFSVKSYNQPRRDQRQQIIAAARELEMMVVPEGGSTFMHNMTMIVDGHTGIEHTLPVQTAYDDVMDLWRNTGVGYTPTLNVAYGGISGEQYWYEVDDLWLHPRLETFIPPHVLVPRSRRRNKAPLEDYNHMRVAEIAKALVDNGGLVQTGGHGQLNGICTHWEMWSFVQGGMKPLDALKCGTLFGAKYLGLDDDLGSLDAGKLADLVVIEAGHDPTTNIRDTERIQYVIANGRVFDAHTMNETGSAGSRPGFFWKNASQGIGSSFPEIHRCGCQRPGATN